MESSWERFPWWERPAGGDALRLQGTSWHLPVTVLTVAHTLQPGAQTAQRQGWEDRSGGAEEWKEPGSLLLSLSCWLDQPGTHLPGDFLSREIMKLFMVKPVKSFFVAAYSWRFASQYHHAHFMNCEARPKEVRWLAWGPKGVSVPTKRQHRGAHPHFSWES